jgi:gliding motility-associated-like protein
MIMLNATEQMFLDSITFFAVDTSAIAKHFVHIITKTADTNVMYLDSTRLTKFNTFTQNTNYSYKSVTVKPGYHRLETTGCGFIAYSMGIGNAVSYGYATGVSLVDLENAITYSNFVDGSDTICKGDTVKFKSLLRGDPLSFYWEMGDGTTDTVKNPIHVYTQPGEYYIKAIVNYECLTDTLRDTLYVPRSPIIDLGPDTTLCNRDTLSFKANTRFFETLWSNGSKDSLLKIVNSGTYSVRVSNYCGVDYDTIVVDSLLPDTVFLGHDLVMCLGNPFNIDISAVNSSTYLWNDSSTAPVKTISKAGTYWGQVQNFCGTMRDTIVVKSDTIPNIDLGNDTVLCSGQTFLLNAYFSRSSYRWQNGTRTAFHYPSIPVGKIWVQVTNLCGAMVDSIQVDYDYPLNINLGIDSIICLGDNIPLDPFTNGADCIWHDGKNDTTSSVTKRGKYWVEASNVCGKFSDTVNYVDEQVPQINLPEDQLKCNGDTVILNASYSRGSYLWNTGATTPSITVSSAGYYQVQITNICGFDRDSLVVVYDKPLVVDLGPDTILCDQGAFSKSIFFPNNPTYAWNTGHNAPSINIARGGKFVVSVTNLCGTYTDAIQVAKYYTPKPQLNADTTLCSGEVLQVTMGLTDLQMQGVFPTWENGSHARARAITKSGKYWVYAENVCGDGSDSAEYTFNSLPHFGLNDTLFCYGEVLQYDFSDYPFHYYWDKELSEGDYFEIDKPGDKLLWIIDSIGCLGVERFTVTLCPNPLFAPNAFTPNSDGINEAFRIYRMGTYDFTLTIVNEWNETVFSSDNMQEGWNGKRNNQGEECPIGAYVWRATFKDVNDHQVQIETGEVMLIR